MTNDLPGKLRELSIQIKRLGDEWLLDTVALDHAAVALDKAETYRKALEEISCVDSETHEALQSTRIDIARTALATEQGEKGE